MEQQILDVTNEDGSRNKLTIFNPIPEEPTEAVVLICPAMGVRASYYEILAAALAKKSGVTAVLADLRGLGHSSIRPSKEVDFGYREMIGYDYRSAINVIRRGFPGRPVFLLGHSLGGQLGSLYASRYPEELNGLILVACCSVYYKGWPGIKGYRVWAGTQLAGILGRFLGYFPGHRIGFGGLGAAGAIRDWSRQARTGKYIVAGDDFDYEQGLKELALPTLAISFSGDEMAPVQAVKNLYLKFSESAKVIHHHLDADLNYSHFNWVKRPAEVIRLVNEWLEANASG